MNMPTHPDNPSVQATRLLVQESAKALRWRIVSTCINASKVLEPIQLKLPEQATHWDELKVIANVWGGPSELNYGEAVRQIEIFMLENVLDLLPHEQATLWLDVAEEVAANVICNRLPSIHFQLQDDALDAVINDLIEELMETTTTFLSDDYEVSEIERAWDARDKAYDRLNGLEKVTLSLAAQVAGDLRQRLLQQLQDRAKGMSSFDMASSEGCASHWDEIVLMAQLRHDHLLYESFEENLVSDALQAISRLSTTEQYALWLDSRYGADFLSDLDATLTDEPPDREGLWEAATTIATDLLGLANQ